MKCFLFICIGFFQLPGMHASTSGHFNNLRRQLDEDTADSSMLVYGQIVSDDYKAPPVNNSTTTSAVAMSACIIVKDGNVTADPILGSCDDDEEEEDYEKRGWRFDDSGRFHTELDDSYCMQVGTGNVARDGSYVRLKPCGRTSQSLQRFIHLPLGGGIRPMMSQDLCMVWQGATANISSDAIIMKTCATVADRIAWSGDAFSF